MRKTVSEFERRLEKEFDILSDSIRVIATNSGTSALFAALSCLDLQGKYVITTPFTYQATLNAILLAGAEPLFVDVNDDCLINESLIEEVIETNHKNQVNSSQNYKSLGAILPVHLFGRHCHMHKINEIAKRYNLVVIEDACQSLFVCDFHKGDPLLPAGCLGDIGCYSFYESKNLSTFEGGAISINKENPELEKRIRAFINNGETEPHTFEYVGLNLRMHPMAAMMGLERLNRHRKGIYAEIGSYSERDGYYPKLVYQQPAIQGKLKYVPECPNAERIAGEVARISHGLWQDGKNSCEISKEIRNSL